MPRYIDGDKLMEHWQEWDWWDKKGMPHCFGYIPDTVVKLALEHPVDVKKVVHAKWEYGFQRGKQSEWLYGCSNCYYVSDSININWHYCPNCGAIMDEEVE